LASLGAEQFYAFALPLRISKIHQYAIKKAAPFGAAFLIVIII